MTKEAHKDQFVRGIRTLCDVHFSNHDECQRADIMGELLFNSRIFTKEASNNTTAKDTASMANCIFNAVNILKAIDSKAGSLNDTAVDEYAKIEFDSNLTTNKKGKGILQRRHYLTGTRKIANGLVDHLFSFVDESGKPLAAENHDMILFEPARLFRFMIEVFDLKEKALRRDLLFAFTGDAAALSTGGTEAGQFLCGLKAIDQDAKNPLTGEPLLYKYVENDDGISKLTYHGAQSTNCCLVAGACLMKETEALETACFCRILDCVLGIQNKGLKQDRDEPAIPYQRQKVVCCGDMAFQQKMAYQGGACK